MVLDEGAGVGEGVGEGVSVGAGVDVGAARGGGEERPTMRACPCTRKNEGARTRSLLPRHLAVGSMVPGSWGGRERAGNWMSWRSVLDDPGARSKDPSSQIGRDREKARCAPETRTIAHFLRWEIDDLLDGDGV
jgi:hypothetical protein